MRKLIGILLLFFVISPSSYPALLLKSNDTNRQADVVGRDLYIIGLSWAGHVGIISDTYGKTVLEVLDDPEVVHTYDPLLIFKNTTHFWGEVYHLPGAEKLSDKIKKNIITAGSDQIHYKPRYTAGYQWQWGGSYLAKVYSPLDKQWSKVNSFHQAILRCDSFVYGSYSAGANLSIPGGALFMHTPKTVYDSFLDKRSSVNPLPGTVASKTPALGAGISAALAAKTVALNTLDVETARLVREPYVTKGEKAITLWDIASQYKDNDLKYSYST